jgi:hypothetical protein
VVGQLHPELLQRIADQMGLRLVTVGLMTDQETFMKRIEGRLVSEKMKDIWRSAYHEQSARIRTASRVISSVSELLPLLSEMTGFTFTEQSLSD